MKKTLAETISAHRASVPDPRTWTLSCSCGKWSVYAPYGTRWDHMHAAHVAAELRTAGWIKEDQ